MRLGEKPVRKCYACLLNLGDCCWLYLHPRGQWRGRKTCRAFGNEEIYREFREDRKQPSIRTRKDLRREAFRTVKRQRHYQGFKKTRRRR